VPQGNDYQLRRVDHVHSHVVNYFYVCAEELELKRQRARERYEQNKEEINKRRREAYKQKRTIATETAATQTLVDVSLGNIDPLCLVPHHI
jgi:predicted phosphoribosyltransferase